MNKEQLFKVLLEPHVSEKTTNVSDFHGQYVFKVISNATKLDIKKAIELIYHVKVSAVRTLIRKGKRKRNSYGIGKRNNIKLAYVSLEVGHEIKFTDVE